MALKPYLEAVRAHCEGLSREELLEVILEIAQEKPMAARAEFLDKIGALAHQYQSLFQVSTAGKSEEDTAEIMFERIAALKEEIEERRESIEDGSYWDDSERWSHDDEEPEWITDEQADELENLFIETGGLFLDGQLETAGSLYRALFDLLHENDAISAVFSPSSLDLREARARYCRCVVETADPAQRLDDLFECMDVQASINRYRLELPFESFPMLQDVLDARPGEIPGSESFLPAWEEKLKSCDTSRAAALRLEATLRLYGIGGIARLAREWQSREPRGYLYWIQRLDEEEDRRGMIDACLEALEDLPRNSFREQAAGYLVTAAKLLGDEKLVLHGRRECFLSAPNENNLLRLLDEAEKQGVRSNELNAILAFKDEIKACGGSHGHLYIKVLLMAGRLDEAFDEAKNEESVGWAYGKAGVLFSGILSAAVNNAPKAVVIAAMLKEYAKGLYSGFRDGMDEQEGMRCEMAKGLSQVRLTTSDRRKYVEWADKIGRDRIERIVSNQRRGAYDRAARVLGALAECCLVLGEREKAASLIKEFVHVKFKRHHAFRSEVKRVMAGSALLKGLVAV